MTQDEIIDKDEILKMARKAGVIFGYPAYHDRIAIFAKLVAAKAVAKDRKEFDIDELCARQNKIGYKQGYNAGVKAEREACVDIVDNLARSPAEFATMAEYKAYKLGVVLYSNAVRARAQADGGEA